MIELDLRDTINSLRSANANLSVKQFNLAIVRAINRTATTGRADSVREVRSRYNIRAKNIRDDITIRRARPGQLTGMIIALGRPIPIVAFNPRQNKTGVTIDVLGVRKKIERAFIATMNSGHKGVFARGRYTKGKQSAFDFRKRRQDPAQYGNKFITKNGNRFPIDKPDLPINELYTLSVPAAMQNHNVMPKIVAAVEKNFEKRMIHELKFIQSKL